MKRSVEANDGLCFDAGMSTSSAQRSLPLALRRSHLQSLGSD